MSFAQEVVKVAGYSCTVRFVQDSQQDSTSVIEGGIVFRSFFLFTGALSPEQRMGITDRWYRG